MSILVSIGIYYAVTFILTGIIIIKAWHEIGFDEDILASVFGIASIIIGPVIFTGAVIWCAVESLLDHTVRRGKLMAATEKTVASMLPKTLAGFNDYLS